MKLLRNLRNVNGQSFWALLKLGVMNPLFIVPTLSATNECMRTSTAHFGNEHFQNGRANAFRHAYWNYLIAKKCTKWSKNDGKILKWSKNITDWHEDAFQNKTLARLMDCHNNAIGRKIFSDQRTTSIDGVIKILLEMTKASNMISNEGQLNRYPNSLVHISE